MKKQSLLFLLIFSLLLPLSTVLAQGSGRIAGTVTDSTTGEALFGANVYLEGQSLGAATDFEGKFRIAQIPAGSYTLIVRYIGYQERDIPVRVTADQTLELDIALLSQVIEGEEVTVTAQALGQKQAINQQLTSNTIKNVVSSEKIQELPDNDAATALSRLPGVSLMNGDQVVIRGVEAKLNQVLVNGIQMPSTDMNNRSTNLGFISSNMLSGIEVIKAITPDMDANTVGGVVNLKLMEAPEKLHFDILTQGNYNRTDRNVNNYKVWGSVSNRFFDNKLGVFVQANAERSDGGNQRAGIGLAQDGSSNLKYGESVYLTTSATMDYHRSIVDDAGGSVILDYKLPNGKIVLQNTYAGTFTDQRNHRNQLDFNGTSVLYTIDRNKYGKDLWINALQAENYFGDIKVEASLSHSNTKQYTRIAYQPGTWTEFSNITGEKAPFGYNQDGTRKTYTGLADQRGLLLQNAYRIFDNLNPADVDSSTREGWVSSISNTFEQHLYDAAADVTVPINFTNDITAEFKAGGKYTRTTRENDFDRYFTGAGDADTYNNVKNFFDTPYNGDDNHVRLTEFLKHDFDRGKTFLEDEYDFQNGFRYVIDVDIYDDWLRTSQKGWESALKEDDSWKDDWNGSESFTAGYLMGTFNFFQKFTLLGGVRYERYNMKYNANFTYITHNVYGDAISTAVGTITTVNDPDSLYHNIPSDVVNTDRTDINWFPNVHLKYKPNDWSDVRVAYTTGISRPDYLSLIPKTVLYPGNNYEVGNPKLQPTTAQSFDLIFSFYTNEIGLLTINGFYKELEDVMYTTGIYYGNLSEYANISIPDSAFLMDRFGYKTKAQDVVNTSLNNTNTGYIRGVEIGWQTNFWYLPQPLNSLVLDVNYTYSNSNMDYRIIRNVPETVYLPGNPRPQTVYTTIDTVFSGRLIQQAKDVLNVALGVDYKGFSGRISFNMRGDVLNSVGRRPEETSRTGNIYRWDFTVKQKLPLDGLSVSFSGINIFHNGIKSYRNYRLEPDAPVTENLVTVLYPPTIYQFNLRYSF